MLAHIRKFPMPSEGSGSVCGFGLFFRFEQAQVFIFVVRADERGPSVAVFPFVDAFDAGRVVSANPFVPLILGAICLSQIANSVVRANPVGVVNLTIRPSVAHHQPSEAVGKVHRSVYADKDVSAAAIPGLFALLPVVDAPTNVVPIVPDKFARFGKVCQNATDELGSELFGRFVYRHNGKNPIDNPIIQVVGERGNAF